MATKFTHIIVSCFFLLLGFQSTANERNKPSLCQIEIVSSSTFVSCSNYSPAQKTSYFSSPEKLLKKRRYSKTTDQAITSNTHFKVFSTSAGSISSFKCCLISCSKLRDSISSYSLYDSFPHKKLLSIFYSFQAFW